MTRIDTIIVCGLGAIGSNMLTQLVKIYPDCKYIGVDFDKVEKRNIGTQAYFMEHVGQLKTAAIQGVLRRFTPNVKYHAYTTKVLNPEDIYGIPQEKGAGVLVLDCFDNVEARKVMKQCISLPVYHMGFNTQYCAELCWNKDYEVPIAANPNDVDICTLVDATPFIHFVVNMGVMQVSSFIEDRIQCNHLITNKWNIKQL